jgi:hypothetical protein
LGCPCPNGLSVSMVSNESKENLHLTYGRPYFKIKASYSNYNISLIILTV